ncbi:hypothetical protein ACVMGC_001017 [Bradyrhizobium barranii subsp. barranii]|nr:hypothetical protein [Bradyrhizobium japonicum]MCP1958173.1 hypothetical protein [Bradyrhizobium japonicum]
MTVTEVAMHLHRTAQLDREQQAVNKKDDDD